MDIAIDRRPDAVTVAPAGPLDGTSAITLQEALLAEIAARQAAAAIILDCGRVPYVSSAGLRVLVVVTKELKPHGRRLRLVNVQAEVLQALKMANFTSFIDIA